MHSTAEEAHCSIFCTLMHFVVGLYRRLPENMVWDYQKKPESQIKSNLILLYLSLIIRHIGMEEIPACKNHKDAWKLLPKSYFYGYFDVWITADPALGKGLKHSRTASLTVLLSMLSGEHCNQILTMFYSDAVLQLVCPADLSIYIFCKKL